MRYLSLSLILSLVGCTASPSEKFMCYESCRENGGVHTITKTFGGTFTCICKDE